jgi:hypothetical protein
MIRKTFSPEVQPNRFQNYTREQCGLEPQPSIKESKRAAYKRDSFIRAE